jgi:hypothetical protein
MSILRQSLYRLCWQAVLFAALQTKGARARQIGPDCARGDRVNTKAKGTAREHRSIALLETAGYTCMRAAGSLGVWDIIGIGSIDIVLCQVKSRDFPGSGEMEVLREFICPANCRKLIHRWRNGQPLPDVKEL